ncbi:unnamed protein product [Musa textilis]
MEEEGTTTMSTELGRRVREGQKSDPCARKQHEEMP